MKINDFFQNDSKTYIIAEIAQNHDGSLGQAHAYIDAVAKTGADAIKFQTHIAEAESSPDEPFRKKFSYCDKTRFDYWKRMEFTWEQWKGLFDHALDMGLDFLSSPFSIEAFEMLNQIGIPAWKFGSGEVFNKILLKKAINTGKPIILSTGLSTVEDIDEQVGLIEEAGNPLLLMECTTAYPSLPEEINISMIDKYIRKYSCPVGLSDHSATIFPSLAAITLGARALEVHVTMSRDMFGPDISSSVTIQELKEIVTGVICIRKMLNNKNSKEKLSANQSVLKEMFSKSIYAKKNLKQGDILNSDTMAIKKPLVKEGVSLNDYEKLYGRVVTSALEMNSLIKWENIKK